MLSVSMNLIDDVIDDDDDDDVDLLTISTGNAGH